MKNQHLLLFGILLLYLLAIVFSDPASALDRLDILAFGDSITQGLYRDASGHISGITDPPNGARVGGYEPYLEADISSGLGVPGYVYNWGKGGENSSNAVNRISSVLASRNTDMILIMSSANDPYQGVWWDTTQFNQGVMIDKSRQYHTEPVVGTITPNSSGAITSSWINDEYNPRIRSIARRKGVLLADHYAAMAVAWGNYHSGDGLHMNGTGNNKLAQTWFNVLKNSILLNPPARPNASDGTYRDRVFIRWPDVANAGYYKLYRCLMSVTSTCSEIVTLNGLAYNDTGVAFNIKYYYRLKVCNSAGCSGYGAADLGYLKSPDITPILELLLL